MINPSAIVRLAPMLNLSVTSVNTYLYVLGSSFNVHFKSISAYPKNFIPSVVMFRTGGSELVVFAAYAYISQFIELGSKPAT